MHSIYFDWPCTISSRAIQAAIESLKLWKVGGAPPAAIAVELATAKPDAADRFFGGLKSGASDIGVDLAKGAAKNLVLSLLKSDRFQAYWDSIAVEVELYSLWQERLALRRARVFNEAIVNQLYSELLAIDLNAHMEDRGRELKLIVNDPIPADLPVEITLHFDRPVYSVSYGIKSAPIQNAGTVERSRPANGLRLPAQAG